MDGDREGVQTMGPPYSSSLPPSLPRSFPPHVATFSHLTRRDTHEEMRQERSRPLLLLPFLHPALPPSLLPSLAFLPLDPLKGFKGDEGDRAGVL